MNHVGVLFEYMGLEEGEDEGVLKRRVKALRNSRGHSKLRKGWGLWLAKVPLSKKELIRKQKGAGGEE